MLASMQLSSTTEAFVAAVLIGAGLSVAVVGAVMRVRTKQRTLAQILDDTMGTARVPVEVVSESPEQGELSGVTVRIAGIFGRIDTSGALERRLERADIPLRAGEYIVIAGAIAFILAVGAGVIAKSPYRGPGCDRRRRKYCLVPPLTASQQTDQAAPRAAARRARALGCVRPRWSDLPTIDRHVPA